MILNQLTVVNFGLYRGRQTFDLRPQPGRPIVLFGGKNGAGKTTLLEAIRLCLYGPLALDEQVQAKKADYEAYLGQRIHRAPQGVIPIDTASVALEFEHALAGQRRVYAIKRQWTCSAGRTKERLQVYEDGRPLDIDRKQWQAFLKDLIPPGLSQLFFFDGEKIQALASGERGGHSRTLAQATKALLGLNIVEQLQADLSIYRRRQQKKGDLDAAEQQMETLEDELEQVKAALQRIEQKQTQVGEQRRRLEAEIQLQEAEVARAGGGFARQRSDYKEAQIRLEAELEQVEQAIRDLCGELLPFAIAPKYTAAVKDQLLREAEAQQWQASRTFIEQKLDDIQAEIESDQFWQGTGVDLFIDLKQGISRRVTETLQRLVEPPEPVRQTELRHQVAPPEQRQLLQWIAESQETVPGQIQELSDRLGKLQQEQQKVEAALARVPENDVLAPLVEKLNRDNQALGAILLEQEQLAEEWQRLELKEEELRRRLHRAMEKQAASQKLSARIRQVVEVGLALDDFTERLTSLRVTQLAEAFTRNFNALCRKERLIETVEIDPRDFSVSLVQAGGQTLPKAELSAGEKQIYAIAMLWALRQVSGRPLPVIIDTPLGRLDSDHRQNLVERYFPLASHQVVLFSTDTEVDAQFIQPMQTAITRAYHLAHDESAGTTRVEAGYFWSLNGREA